ncbi:MAG: peptidoglycan binding domain-containing protein [Peptoniphilaceae bacterium]|nr:peptidoglycan binding domain-containing protein [Peptoniphilaceae bacterium]MDY6019762.1 peptidoglycan binding domain-containing protein [Anaerococcus sp.]
MPNTYINGKDVSYASKQSVLDDSIKNFNIAVKGRDGKALEFDVKDIDYIAKIPNDASLDQNPFTWPLAFLKNKDDGFKFDYNVKYDDEKLNSIIKSSNLMTDMKEPEDAKVEYKNGKFEIVKEVLGNQIDYDKVKERIVEAIRTHNGDEIDLDDSFYKQPQVKSDDETIKKELEDSKTIENLSYDFDINGYNDKLEGQKLIDMFESVEGKLELNYDKVSAYVKEIADKTNTYGKERKFQATGIGEIIVPPGVYGFILDVDKTVDNIFKLIDQRKSGTVEPEYKRRGFTREADGTDIGNTYIEVDLSRQHLWYYKDGSVVLESNFVSGNLGEGALTNVGVGSILSKERHATLKGEDFDGKTKYETPVEYWMPIGWDGEGFHDAPWRGAFGGNIYQYDGSHGCINLPPATAKRIFEEADFSTPVIVYESSTNFSPHMSY